MDGGGRWVWRCILEGVIIKGIAVVAEFVDGGIVCLYDCVIIVGVENCLYDRQNTLISKKKSTKGTLMHRQ